MKNFLFISLALLSFLLINCSSDDPLPNPDEENPGGNTAVTDTIDFRVHIMADKYGVDRLGGDRTFMIKLEELFFKATNYWNESSDKLTHFYRYTPTALEVYEGSSVAAINKAHSTSFDFGKFDVQVVFDMLKDHEDEGSGAAHGTAGDGHSVVTVLADNNFKDIFTDNTYRTLVHELGHYRGVTDIYQYIISSNDNPVNGEAFNPPACIMSDASAGTWCDYAVNIFNYAAESKIIGHDYPDFFGSLYPKNLEITVLVDKQPKRGVTVHFYGSRAGGSTHGRDIWPEAFRSEQTNAEGKILITDVKGLYNPDRQIYTNLLSSLPYGRWFGFLLEAINGNAKKYGWLPEYEIQKIFFEEGDTYKLTLNF